MQTIHSIGQHFWYMTAVALTDRPILGLVVGEEKSLLIDAGNSAAHINDFLHALAQQQVPLPTEVVLTHWHWDHIFGLAALSLEQSWAHVQTVEEMRPLQTYEWTDEAIDARVATGVEIEFCAKAIKEEFKINRAIEVKLPTQTFTAQHAFNLGGVSCTVHHIGGDHAADSSVVYIHEDKILFLGDILYAKMYAEKTHYTVDGICHVLDALQAFDADVYIPSHEQPITKKEFEKRATMLRRFAHVTEQCKGDSQAMRAAYEQQVGRPYSEEELELHTYFVDGYEG